MTGKKDKCEQVLLDWIRLINKVMENEAPYYVAKAMDLFYALPFPYQKGFLEYVVEQIPNKQWEELIKDETQYVDAIRSILLYYTGRKELGQPSLQDFKQVIGNWMKTEGYKTTKKEIKSFGVTAPKAFTELLHEV